MMLTIIDHLHQKYPSSKFGLSIMRGSFSERNKHNLYHILRYESKRFTLLNNLLGFGFLIPKLLRKYYNILLDSDIDVVLDASGFQYSSQWGFKETKLMAKWSQSWNEKGKKIILMPQAFGPFNENEIKSYMMEIINNCHLIFARDKTSFNYLYKIISTKKNEQKIYLSPDFTNLYKAKINVNKMIRDKKVCIIPNYRMIDKMNDNSYSYIKFLLLLIEYFNTNNIAFYFLIHSSGEINSINSDMEIINILLREIPKVQFPILELSDPIAIKNKLADAKFIISSRFHGLINGLSQNVPSVATSWSHKYVELMETYNLGYLCIKNLSIRSEIIRLLNKLNNEKELNAIIHNLKIKNELLKNKTNQMWKIIDNEIIRSLS